METRNYITNQEKAVMVHNLFTSEIPHILNYMQLQYRNLDQFQEERRSKWNTIVTFDFWLAIAKSTNDLITRERQELTREAEEFGSRLTINNHYFFLNHCMINYGKHVTKNSALRVFVKKIYC